MTINIFNETDQTCPSAEQFQHWTKQVFEHQQTQMDLSIRIIDVDTMAMLNQQFRGKSGPTNVLSFPNDDEFSADNYLGDIAICANVVTGEAKAQNKPLEHHYAHLTIHGVLHLFGYDHIDEQEAHVMETLEVTLLKQLGICNPYSEYD